MRSKWTLGILVLLLGLHGASLALPWYTYSHSTGRTLPPEYPSNETGENVTQWSYHPFEVRGDVNESEEAEARRLTQPLGIGVSISISIVFIALAIELLWGQHEWSRWPGMGLSVLGLCVTILMLLFVFFLFHPTLQDQGVTGTFTNRQISTGFVRSTVAWGWITAFVAGLGHLTHFAFRYQQGSLDMNFAGGFRPSKP